MGLMTVRQVAHQFADAEVTVTPSGTSTRANAIAIPEGVVNASLAVLHLRM